MASVLPEVHQPRVGEQPGDQIASDVQPDMPMARPELSGSSSGVPGLGGASGGDDLSGTYAQHVEDRSKAAALDAINRQLQQLNAPALPAAGASSGAPPAAAPQVPAAKPGQEQAPGETGPLATGVAAAKDIAQGLGLEAVPAALMGVADAVGNTRDLVDGSLRWLEKEMGFPELGPEATPRMPDVLDPRKIFPEPKTVTGGVIRDVSQFLAGWYGAGKQLKGLGVPAATGVARVAESAAKGAITGFEAFDGQSAKLGDLLTKLGVPETELTTYLSSSPDDTETEGRFKNALGNVFTGLAVDGILGIARALRGAVIARQAGTTAPGTAAAAAAQGQGIAPGVAQVTDRDIAVLGNPKHPLVSRQPSTGPFKLEYGALSPAQLLGKDAATAPPIIRLYRGEGPRDAAKQVAAGAPATGRWFTTDLNEAARYAKDNAGSVYYVDVTKKDLAGAAAGATAPDRHFVLGDEAAARMQPLSSDTPAFAAPSATPTDRLYINLARIDTPEDIHTAIDNAAQAMKPTIDAARRGTQTFKGMQLSAQQEDAFQALAQRGRGEALRTPEQNIAARQLWATSATRLVDLAKIASASPSDANLFAFRRQLAMHNAIQEQVIAARTEAARSLAVWRIPAGSSMLRAQEIQRTLDNMGGSDVAKDLATKVAALGSSGQARKLEQFVAKGAWARTRDAALKVWINWGLLSGPQTHIANTVSNISVAAQQIYETATARQIAKLLGDDQSVQAGEAMTQLVGTLHGFGREGLQNAMATIRTGQGLDMATRFGASKLEGSAAVPLSEADAMAKTDHGRFWDVLRVLPDLPGRMLASEDAYFKTGGYRAKLWQLAQRQASLEIQQGKIAPYQLKSRVASLINNPPDELQAASINAADYQTFNNAPGAIARTVMKLKGLYPALNLIIPFTRTPANILTYSIERSPLAYPLLSRVRSDIAAGGARRDVALARMATGTALMQMSADLALSGVISGRGPDNPETLAAMKRTGWQPYSVKIGDRWYAYNRFDPAGTTIGQAADLVELMHNTEWDPNDQKPQDALWTAVALSIVNNSLNKTYLSSMSDLIDAIHNPEQASATWTRRLIGSVVPTGAATVAKAMDPTQREVSDWISALRARTPALTQGLAARRDMWGRPMGYDSGIGWAYDVFSPIYSRRENPEPIDREILHQGWLIPDAQRAQSFGDATINMARYPQVWSHFKELRGQGVTDAFRHNLIDTLNGYVMGQHPLSGIYSRSTDGPGGGKEQMVRKAINDFTGLARDRLVTEKLDGMTPQLQSEMSQFRAELHQRAQSAPARFQGMPPPRRPLAPGVLP